MGVRRLWRYRAVRFGVVAASCTLGQLLVLAWLTRLGVSEVVANGIGFVLSAQANFVLSAQITWRDRKHPVRSADFGAWPARWVSFNTVAIAALAVNELVFTMGVHAGSAALYGIVGRHFGWRGLVTFTLQQPRHVPGDGTPGKSASGQLERRPGLEEISGRGHSRVGSPSSCPPSTRQRTCATFVPAGWSATSRAGGLPFHDHHRGRRQYRGRHLRGGRAASPRNYPGYVQAVHHSQEQGLRRRASDRFPRRSGHRAWPDRVLRTPTTSSRSRASGRCSRRCKNQDADLAVGYRIARADSLKRRVMGRSWHWLSSLVPYSAPRQPATSTAVSRSSPGLALKAVEPRIKRRLCRGVTGNPYSCQVGWLHDGRGGRHAQVPQPWAADRLRPKGRDIFSFPSPTYSS